MVGRRWYQHPAIVVGSLLLCFPIGFVLVFLTAWSNRAKVLAAGGGTLLALVLAIGSATAPPAPSVSAGGSVPVPGAAVPSTTASTTTSTTSTTSTTIAPTTTIAPAPPPTTVAKAAPASTKAPAAPKTTTTAAAKPTSGCSANYSGCVPLASDVDCAGGKGDGPAYLTGTVRVLGTDVYGLDSDANGVACD